MSIVLFVVISLLLVAMIYINAVLQKDNPFLFKSFINNYRKIDEKLGVERCENVFTGSSIMKFWKSLEVDLYQHDVINRAIPGTKINEISYYVEDLVNR